MTERYKRERYKREIEEIIEEAGDLSPKRPLRQHFKEAQDRAKDSLNQEMVRWFRWITPTRVGGLGAILLIGSLLVRNPVLVIISIGLLLSAYLLSVIRGKTSFQEATGFEKTWRGEPIDYDNYDRSSHPWGRLRRFFGKKRE